jgi:hypothetical protein
MFVSRPSFEGQQSRPACLDENQNQPGASVRSASVRLPQQGSLEMKPSAPFVGQEGKMGDSNREVPNHQSQAVAYQLGTAL